MYRSLLIIGDAFNKIPSSSALNGTVSTGFRSGCLDLPTEQGSHCSAYLCWFSVAAIHRRVRPGSVHCGGIQRMITLTPGAGSIILLHSVNDAVSGWVENFFGTTYSKKLLSGDAMSHHPIC